MSKIQVNIVYIYLYIYICITQIPSLLIRIRNAPIRSTTKRGILMPSLDKLPYPWRKSGNNKFVACANISIHLKYYNRVGMVVWNTLASHWGQIQEKWPIADRNCDVRDDVLCQHVNITGLFWSEQKQIWLSNHLIQIEYQNFKHCANNSVILYTICH